MTIESACQDLYAVSDYYLPVNYTVAVSTGFAVQIPKGYFLEIRSRSGLSLQGVVVNNSPAVIDSDYRGEVKVLLKSTEHPHKVKIGDRIAQARIVKCIPTKFTEVEELDETERGDKGFGSTGK